VTNNRTAPAPSIDTITDALERYPLQISTMDEEERRRTASLAMMKRSLEEREGLGSSSSINSIDSDAGLVPNVEKQRASDYLYQISENKSVESVASAAKPQHVQTVLYQRSTSNGNFSKIDSPHNPYGYHRKSTESAVLGANVANKSEGSSSPDLAIGLRAQTISRSSSDAEFLALEGLLHSLHEGTNSDSTSGNTYTSEGGNPWQIRIDPENKKSEVSSSSDVTRKKFAENERKALEGLRREIIEKEETALNLVVDAAAEKKRRESAKDRMHRRKGKP
jgi:hypothetical protein